MSQIDTATATDEVEPAQSEGWLPAKIMGEWPSFDTRQLIMKRRKSLYEAMQSLEAAAARASGQPDWMEKVQESLSALLAALNRHVEEIEADDGLFADVLERAPRMRPMVESLRQDHDEISEACRSALDLARERPDTRPRAMRRRIMRILGRLSMHRQDGAELLFDTHNLDLAAGD
ncbi:MAG: hemerythrin domain-containing protein [Acidimicrobiia bacterium]